MSSGGLIDRYCLFKNAVAKVPAQKGGSGEINGAPEELTSSLALMNFPPIEMVPDFLRGRSFAIVRGCHSGSLEDAKEQLRFWRDWRAPEIDLFGPMPFSAVAMISNDPVDPIPGGASTEWLSSLDEEVAGILGRSGDDPQPMQEGGAFQSRKMLAPGERWAYSNTNYKALALIAERVAGEPFDTVLAKRVLRPAGLDSVGPCHDLPAGGFVPGFAPDGKAAPLDASRAAYAGDGGLCASAAGLATWLRRGLAARGGAPPLFERLATPTRLSSGQVVPYGFGVSTREFLGHPMIWHAGNVDGHSALVAHAPQDDLHIVVLTNEGFVWLTEILPAWIAEAVPARAEGSGEPPLGVFDDALFRYEISVEGADLKVAIDRIGPLVFVPTGPGRYVARDYPATFLVRLPGDGSSDAFEMDWGEVRSYARRVVEHPRIHPVRVGDYLDEHPATDKLGRLFPGSWIQHNFGIWIGHHECNRAWDELYKTRQFLVQAARNKQRPAEQIARAWREMHIAEGSDWYWWFGDSHHSAQDGLSTACSARHSFSLPLFIRWGTAATMLRRRWG